MTAREFCPQCGNARTASFRFCRTCGFDYDSAPPAAAASAPTVHVPSGAEAPAAGTGDRPGLFTAAGILWLVVAALNLLVLLLLVAGAAADGIGGADAIGIGLAVLLVLLAFAVGSGLLKNPSRASAFRSAALAAIFVVLTLVALGSLQADSLATMVNIIQGVAVILAGTLPLLALGQVRR